MHLKKHEEPKKGYEIIKYTLEGNKALRHMKLAVKKVPRAEARSVICDIGIYRDKDKDTIPDECTPLA